nr:uncharacterized protein LOC119173605 [Rhipicephalus microplus]
MLGIIHFYSWSVAMAMWNPWSFAVGGFAVHPVVHEHKENDQMKIVVIEPGRAMELKRASILAPVIVLREYTKQRTTERYVNGTFYERHLYENPYLKASLLVKPHRRGHYHIVGVINSTHYIKPLRNQMDFKGRTRHIIQKIPSSQGHTCQNTIGARSIFSEIFGLPRAKKQPRVHIIETSIISDYSHTKSLEVSSLDPLEYVITYMHRVSLDFNQLKPSVKIMLTGYQTTREEDVEYVNFTSRGVLAAMETVVKLTSYVAKTKPHKEADLVILISAADRRVDEATGSGSFETAPLIELGDCSPSHDRAATAPMISCEAGVKTQTLLQNAVQMIQALLGAVQTLLAGPKSGHPAVMLPLPTCSGYGDLPTVRDYLDSLSRY